MGQNPHDGSIAYFPHNGGSVGRSRSKYSLASALDLTVAEAPDREGHDFQSCRHSCHYSSGFSR
jgi:hypothetical protein